MKTRRQVSFTTALRDATKRLGAANKEQAHLTKRLTALQIEIPRLRTIIFALGGTVTPSPATDAPEGYSLPFGAIQPPSAQDVSNEVPDLNTLPGMNEEFQ